MAFEPVVHTALPVYVLAGHFSAYRIAKRTVKENHSTARPGRVTRWAGMSMLVIMPVAAFPLATKSGALPLLLGSFSAS